MKKLLISTFAAAVMLLFGGVNEVNADPLTYEVVGNYVTITDCLDIAGEVRIPRHHKGKIVTRIGGGAFLGCSNLTSVIIPEMISSIGSSAFSRCTSLTSVSDPAGDGISFGPGVGSIGERAFYGCSSLSSVTIVFYRDNDISIGQGAFEGCSSLTSVTIPENVYSIGPNAFRGCSSLAGVRIPDRAGGQGIARGTFFGCSSLTRVIFPDTLFNIEGYAFSGCSSLTSVRIPKSVYRIVGGAFSRCSSLTSIEVDKGNTENSSEDGVLFGKSPDKRIAGVNILGKRKARLIQFPAGKSGHYTIPESVASIEGGAFYGCSSLTSVTIPESVTSIGGSAFRKCSSLTSVTIPESVISIEVNAFGDCSSLTSIEVGEGNTAYSSEDGVLYGNSGSGAVGSITYKTELIQFPAGKSGHYTIHYYDFFHTIARIGDYAFYGCSGLTSVRIPWYHSVISIGDYAFYGCSSLTNIYFADSVPSIGTGAFEEVSNDAIIFVTQNAGITQGRKEWGKTFAGLPVQILEKPKITLQPESQIVQLGDSAMFEVAASITEPLVTEPLEYQWYKDGEQIEGATSPTYQISKVSHGDFGNYWVFVEYVMVAVSSQVAELKQGFPVAPWITLQPESQIVEFGDSATLKVAASGTRPFEYQWYKDGKQMEGAIGNTYQIASVSQSDLGIYSVWAQNKLGRAYSQTVKLSLPVLHTLTVGSRNPDSGVSVTVSPEDWNGQSDGTTQFTRVYYKGTEVTLSAKQSVGSNEFKQWLANGVPVSNESTVVVTMDYDRTLRAVYEVVSSPIITTHPISQTVDAGASVTFSVAATGTQPLSYRWRRNGVFLGPATESSTLTLGNVQPEQGGTYRVAVSNAAGTVMSEAAELGVKEILYTLTVASRDPDSGVTVTLSPADRNGQAGGTTQFTRVYSKGTEVMLSANQSVGSNQFKQWLANGEPAGTGRAVTVTMDYDRTLRAVYEPKFVLKYKVSGDTVTITDCNETATGDLVIPSTYEGKPITSIGSSAFKDCSSLTSVTIPNSVTSIGSNAFTRCSSLTSVTIPDSVTSIVYWAFKDCRSLESITFEGNAPSLGVDVFSGVSKKAKIFIKTGATGFGESLQGLPVVILDLSNALLTASKEGQLETVKLLLAQGANIEAKLDGGATPLFWASRRGHLEVVEFLVSKGANIEAKGLNGWNPLLTAASYGHLEIVKFLISNGADIETKFNSGETSLYWASHKGHLEVVKFLISKGADIEAKGLNGWSPLLTASYNGHLEIVKLLLAQGANIEAKLDIGATSLNLASQEGHKDVVEFLVSKGADIEAKTNSGWTPLLDAVAYGNLGVVELLLNEGANLEARDGGYGATPLVWSVFASASRFSGAHPADYKFEDHDKIFKLLLSRGANINAANNQADTAFDNACLHNRPKVIDQLKDYIVFDNLNHTSSGKLGMNIKMIKKGSYKNTSGEIVITIPELKYEVQASKNLLDWETIKEIKNTRSLYRFVDSVSQTTDTRNYYRVKSIE